MAVLEKIRNRSLFLIVIIGLALFAFVIGDLFKNGNFGSSKKAMGSINGEVVSADLFRQKVDGASRRYGANASTSQVVNSVWEQEVRNTVLNEQYEALGLRVEKDQIVRILKDNPSFANDERFKNEAGVFDAAKFIEFIADLKANNPQAYQMWKLQEASIIASAKETNYFNLVKAGLGATLKDGELDYKLQNDKVNIQYVQVPYSSIADSTIAVSDAEVKAYIKDHENDFKAEASRDIQFVMLKEEASDQDKAQIKASVAKLIEDTVEYNKDADKNQVVQGLKNTVDAVGFVNANSAIKFDSTFVTASTLPQAHADAIAALEIGGVYGPYQDNGFYKATRVLAKSDRAAVTASHILISYDSVQGVTPKESRTKAQAKAKAQELLASLKKDPKSFEALAKEHSEDPGSAAKGGTYEDIAKGTMVPAFDTFIFSKPVGTLGVVETQFGFHIIQVEKQTNGVQLATIAQPIEASEATINALFAKATTFEMQTLDGADFIETAKKENLEVRPVEKIKVLDENLPGLQNQRSIVKWAFEKGTDIGAIKRFSITDGYVIAQVTAKAKKGLASVKDASTVVLPILRNKKKAAQIMAANKDKDLATLAKDNKTYVKSANDLNMKNPTISGAGREPLVVGSAFALEKDAVSDLIIGENGVYKVKVIKKQTAAALPNYATFANTKTSLNTSSATQQAYSALKKSAEIEDNRAYFY